MPKGVRRTIRRPKAQSLTLVHRAPPPVVEVDPEAFEFDPAWTTLRPDFKRRREEFCRQYILDFNGAQAIVRMGSQSKTPWVRASEYLAEPYTQWFLGQLLRTLDDKAIVTRSEILLGLKKEAHYHGLDGSAAARIAAWRTMGKILGLEVTKVEGNLNLSGGVMLMPFSGTPEEWEKAAQAAQERLKKDVRQ